MLISGGKVTVAQLFVNLSSGRIGLLGMWDVVAFDEVAGLEMSDSTVINMLKDYMESGSFARGKEETPAEASVVFIGNTSKPHQELVRTAHLFADLPKAMIDPAFLDRLHYYLPGWEAPKLEQRLFTGHFGLVSDYLAEALRPAPQADLRAGHRRGLRARVRTCQRATRRPCARRSPGCSRSSTRMANGRHGELREYLEFAMEGRRRVKEQLKKLAAHDYAKTAFSYVERDTGREVWVEVPEQPEELDVDSTGDGTPRTASRDDDAAPAERRMLRSPTSSPAARAPASSSSRRRG